MNKLIITKLKIVLLTKLICLLKRLYIPAVLNILILFFFNQTAISQNNTGGYEHELYRHYANTNPNRTRPEWGNEKFAPNGITHDSLNWYIASIERDWKGVAAGKYWKIWQIPVTQDLNNFNKNVKTADINILPLSLRNYGHIGDIDHYKYKNVDYLVLPLTGDGETPIIVFLNAKSLVYTAHIVLDNLKDKSIGWCAVSPDGHLFTSEDNANEFLSYTLNWDSIAVPKKKNSFFSPITSQFIPRQISAETLTPHRFSYPGGDTLHNLQGGEFTPDGKLLYISCGGIDCKRFFINLGKYPEDGIHVFNTLDWEQVLESSNRTRFPNSTDSFNFSFDNGCQLDEPEGLTIWDIDHVQPRPPENLVGHLHVLVANHTPYQIAQYVLDWTKKVVPPTGYIAQRIKNVFNRNAWKSKASIHHFGPYPYCNDCIDVPGPALSEQEKIEEAFQDKVKQLFLAGDTNTLKELLISDIKKGTPVIPPYKKPDNEKAGNSQSEIIKAYAEFKNNRQDYNSVKAVTVTEGIPPCPTAFDHFLYKKNNGTLVICKTKNSNCETINEIPVFTFQLPNPSNLVNATYNVSFIPVMCRKINSNSKNDNCEFTNDIGGWNNSGDAEYKSGPDLNEAIQLEYPDYDMKFVIPMANGVYLAENKNSNNFLTPIQNFDIKWLNPNNSNNTNIQDFLINLAIVAAYDPKFEVIDPPVLPGKPWAIVKARVLGKSYLIYVSGSIVMRMIDDQNSDQDLPSASIVENYFSFPARNIRSEFMIDGKTQNQILSYLPIEILHNSSSLPDQLRATDKSLKNLKNKQQVRPGNFLIKESFDYEVIDPTGKKTSNNWYKNGSFSNNKYLMRLAILYPDLVVFNHQNYFVIMGNNIKSIYILLNDNDKLKIFDFEKCFKLNPKMEITNIKGNYIGPAAINVNRAQQSFFTNWSNTIEESDYFKKLIRQ